MPLGAPRSIAYSTQIKAPVNQWLDSGTPGCMASRRTRLPKCHDPRLQAVAIPIPLPFTLLHHVAIDVEPPSALANEATAFVLAQGGGIADTRTRDELDFGRSSACNARINDIQAQPLLILAEWNRTGSRARVPCREQVSLVA
jgi:hypothetical protein